MPAGCLYTPQTFLDKNPATAQALANAIVRADHWIQNAGARDIINAVPENYLLGDRAVYVDAFLAAKGALSPDGMIPEAGAETARRALASIDPEIASAKIDLAGDLDERLRQARQREVPEGLSPHRHDGARARAPGFLPVHRSEALTDGIYAVAMTLLVIDLKLPEGRSIHSDDDLAAGARRPHCRSHRVDHQLHGAGDLLDRPPPRVRLRAPRRRASSPRSTCCSSRS